MGLIPIYMYEAFDIYEDEAWGHEGEVRCGKCGDLLYNHYAEGSSSVLENETLIWNRSWNHNCAKTVPVKEIEEFRVIRV